jgi:hypothetical protein
MIDIYTIFAVPNEDESLGFDMPWHVATLIGRNKLSLLQKKYSLVGA